MAESESKVELNKKERARVSTKVKMNMKMVINAYIEIAL